MLQVLGSAWALLLGMLLLMIGNGMQFTLVGVRGDIEGFGTLEMSIIVSAYFAGFLGGSRLAPEMIRRVGHVRVFAALGSLISAVMILYPTLTDPVSWTLGRVIIGFCFSGVYVTAESWLNNAATNETRGQALSLYMIVQTLGIVAAQGLMLVADPGGFVPFVIASVVISVAFAPILLSISPTPAFETAKPLSLRELFNVSPLGCVGMFLLGGVFSGLFGMASVYGGEAGLTVAQISAFVAALFVGALVLQYPLGWVSDRMDRRRLILIVALAAGGAASFGMLFGSSFLALLAAAFFMGGLTNPTYSLLIAYTNDFLAHEDMAAASGGLVFINGLGAIAGPMITGWIMGAVGAWGFFLFIALLMFLMAAYAAYRMTQRPSQTAVEDTTSYAPLAPTASPVAVEVAQEVYIETELDEATESA